MSAAFNLWNQTRYHFRFVIDGTGGLGVLRKFEIYPLRRSLLRCNINPVMMETFKELQLSMPFRPAPTTPSSLGLPQEFVQSTLLGVYVDASKRAAFAC